MCFPELFVIFILFSLSGKFDEEAEGLLQELSPRRRRLAACWLTD
jgi:hypothetical protein